MHHRKLSLLLGAFLAHAAISAPAMAEQPGFLRIGTGGAGGTYFALGGSLASALSAPPGALACDKGGPCGVPGLIAIAQATTASVFNNAAVQNGELEAGMASADVTSAMYKGTGTFEGKPHDKLRIVANLSPEFLHLVLPKGHELHGLDELKGMRVGIAQPGSGTQVAVLKILESRGIGRDDIKGAELNQAQSAERLADGQLDAYFYTAGYPVAAMVQLASTKGMELYSFPQDDLDKISTLVPGYLPNEIPASTYPGVDYAVETPAVNALFIVSADLSDDMVYEVTKALWNESTRKVLDNGHAAGKAIRLETALAGIDTLGVPLHPGAERYYREIGLIK
ncbi:TAXI family TRAP transporter solute-binding subunit [Paracoccus sp. MBLB3053]|uniref:TAXI family TRAP transporter solute-binding subunit n=1 Tax=Paracoccus aurantius TaxID=3073814 RepID=A0ABU2HVJ9_9RHOB|nr:TAXI family TRAP transporter solute-binding subunit [Paracoccus sp. MBLB3053]MDS9468767.1 TAXI family TRAP transporter solute-binding subunit [Paracoccus sp. MBLB3053]